MLHRKPPLPPHFNKTTPGICRWCNEAITKTLKSGKVSKATWHQSCVTEYKSIHWPSFTRKLVWRRDKGKCSGCGHQCDRKGKNGWQMDHIIPLYAANGQLWAWKLENLQTLCKPCHKIKTAKEAGERAAARKKTG